MDRETREIIGVYIDERSAEGARKLWNSLPPVYRQCAVCYTDFWQALMLVFFQANAISLLAKIVEKIIILKDLIILCANVFLVS